jgi:hypothetical protein
MLLRSSVADIINQEKRALNPGLVLFSLGDARLARRERKVIHTLRTKGQLGRTTANTTIEL